MFYVDVYVYFHVCVRVEVYALEVVFAFACVFMYMCMCACACVCMSDCTALYSKKGTTLLEAPKAASLVFDALGVLVAVRDSAEPRELHSCWSPAP